MTEAAKQDQSTAQSTRKEFKQAYDLANKAFELIGKHQTPPYPSTYALWYNYAAKTNPEIVNKIDETLAQTGELSVYDINQLHDQYLSSNEIEKQRNEQIGQSFEKEMVNVMKLVQKSLANNDSYSSSLDEAQEMLPDAVSPEKISAIVSNLIEQNREMKEMTESLNEGLQKSQAQIHDLNGQLAEARAESMRDGLTLLANRRSFDQSLAREIESAEQKGTQLSLVLADIDHFKRVNDTFGHQVGDGILQTFASLISKNIKGKDIAARYGGEEFALILPQTNPEDAHKLVDKIRNELEASRLVIKSSGQAVGKVTSSFGISFLRPGMDSEKLIRRADEKLYEAKNNGRNRIEMDINTAAAA